MSRMIGKLMQIAALMLLPIAMLMQVTSGMRAGAGAGSVSVMLLMMVFGIGLFVTGRFVEGYAAK